MNAADAALAVIPHRTPAQQSGTGKAPANIALCKYWGKRNVELKLPLTGSLSISLGELGTETTLTCSDQDRFLLDGQEHDPTSKAVQRFFHFLNLFREPGTSLQVDTRNSIPMAAGLASSASAFAAAVKALNDLFQWTLSPQDQSILARLGSGSACRSIEPGFVEWKPGLRDDGSDSYAERLDTIWPEFRVGILTVSSAPKAVGSSEGMKRTRETSALYASWPTEVSRALPLIQHAIQERDISSLGAAAEQNALSMHATMIGAWPPLIYWQPETLQALHRIHALRAEGMDVFATLDAGPNVKLLFLESDEDALTQQFPELQIVQPFD